MNLVVGVDPAVSGSETTAAMVFKIVSRTWQPEMEIVTAVYPYPFLIKLWNFIFSIPEGCLSVWADEES